MTQIQIIEAMPAIRKLLNASFPAKKAYQIYLLSKQINSIYDFFIAEERKLVQKFRAKNIEDKKISFDNAGDAEQFENEYKALQNLEITDITAVALNEEDVKDIELTPLDIFYLEGLINFN